MNNNDTVTPEQLAEAEAILAASHGRVGTLPTEDLLPIQAEAKLVLAKLRHPSMTREHGELLLTGLVHSIISAEVRNLPQARTVRVGSGRRGLFGR